MKKAGSESKERQKLEQELIGLLPGIDEQGLVFLLQQARILIHNAQVQELNRELVELEKKAQKIHASTVKAAPQRAAVQIDEAENKKTFFLTLGAVRKVLNLEEMRRLVKICYAAESKSDALRQLYTVFSRERGDILADAKIAGPRSPILDELFYAIRAKYHLEDR